LAIRRYEVAVAVPPVIGGEGFVVSLGEVVTSLRTY
jgi:hypothetical protein